MKNTIKMSLVAALAVAGLSQTASAGSLEEAIKGVSVKGKVEVGFNATETKYASALGENNLGSNNQTSNDVEYDIDIAFKVPVNDMITANVAFQADHSNNVQDGNNTDTNNSNAAGNDNITLTKMYFTYANGPVTTMVGKQGVGTPFFGDERGDGIVATYNAGVATVAAAHFRNVNATASGTALGGQDINAAGVIAKVGPVNASAWYAEISDVGDAYSLQASGSIDIVNIDVRHSAIETDASGALGAQEGSLTKVVASVGLDVATLVAGYATTSDETDYFSVDLTADNDAATNFALDDLSVAQLEDADAWLIGAVVPMGDVTLSATYVDGELGSGAATGANLDFDELDLEASYAMSKNFKASVLYTTAEISSNTYENETIQTSLKYSF